MEKTNSRRIIIQQINISIYCPKIYKYKPHIGDILKLIIKINLVRCVLWEQEIKH